MLSFYSYVFSLANKTVKMMGVSQSGSGSGAANDQGEVFRIQSVSISAKGMNSKFEALYSTHFTRSYIIVHSFIPFQTGSGLCVALDAGYCRCPLVPPMLYVIDFWQKFLMFLQCLSYHWCGIFRKNILLSPNHVWFRTLVPFSWILYLLSSFDSLNSFERLTQPFYLLRRFDSRSKCMRICNIDIALWCYIR